MQIFQRKPKKLVGILGEDQPKFKLYPIDGDRIIIRTPRKGRGGKGWMPKFSKDCFIPYQTSSFFGLIKKTRNMLLVAPDATSCLKISEGKIEKPIWDAHTEKEVATADAIDAAGRSYEKKVSQTLMIISLLFSGISFVLLLLIARGIGIIG